MKYKFHFRLAYLLLCILQARISKAQDSDALRFRIRVYKRDLIIDMLLDLQYE
jgi:hypothetical protein